MSFKIDLNGHKRIPGWVEYNELEHRQVNGHDLIPLYYTDGKTTRLVGKYTAQGLQDWYRGLPRQNRNDTRDGAEAVLSVPASIRRAMKDHGLLDTPQMARMAMGATHHHAMRELAKHARGKTTGGRLVPVGMYYVVMDGVTNRAGEVCPDKNIWIMGRGQDAKGTFRAVDFDKLKFGPKAAQAIANMYLSNRLLKAGILCGPDRHSMGAFGYGSKTKRSRQMNQGMNGRQGGAGARARAAKSTRAKKPRPTWQEAVNNLKDSAFGTVGDFVTSLDRTAQAHLASRAVKAAFRYHVQSGFSRFTSTDVKATAAHLCLPHVDPAIFQRAFDRLSADPTRRGIRIIKEYQTGHYMYAPTDQVGAEQRAAKAIQAARFEQKAGLSRRQVAKAMAGLNLTTAQFEAVQKLAAPRRATFADDVKALSRLAVAYHRSGRDVHTIGVSGLGGQAHSLMGFLDGTRRTGHLRSLWLGLRREGFFGEPLKVAGMIRRTKPSIRLRKDSLVVLNPGGLENARAVENVLKLAAKKNCKVVLAGPAAKQYQHLCAQYAKHHQSRGFHL